jgi:hypothetical protein
MREEPNPRLRSRCQIRKLMRRSGLSRPSRRA